MVEEFVGPAAAERLRSSVLGAHLDEFCSVLVGLGHPAATIRHKLWIVGVLAGWMAKRHLAIIDLDERRVDEFLDHYRRRRVGFRTTALLLVRQLRLRASLSRPSPPSTLRLWPGC